MTALAARIELERDDGFRLDLALELPSGSTTALVGPNGSGKSTVVAALAGLVAIDAGTIVLGGRSLDDPARGVFVPPEERRIGVVFQDHMLFPHMSAVENVAFGLRSRGATRAAASAIARDWLRRMGLEGLENRRSRSMSGGEAQRVALARTLAVRPDALLLDEPLAALDVASRIEVRHLLAEHLSGFDGPRLLITHDPAEAFLLADTVVVVEGGRITQQGSADDIRLRPLTRYAADLVGINLLRGVATKGRVDVGGHILHVPTGGVAGDVVVTIHPTAVSIHTERPGGSPRNAWETTAERVESDGERVRVRAAGPLPLTVEITPAARDDLGVVEGARIWLAVKATEIQVNQDAGRTAPLGSLGEA